MIKKNTSQLSDVTPYLESLPGLKTCKFSCKQHKLFFFTLGLLHTWLWHAWDWGEFPREMPGCRSVLHQSGWGAAAWPQSDHPSHTLHLQTCNHIIININKSNWVLIPSQNWHYLTCPGVKYFQDLTQVFMHILNKNLAKLMKSPVEIKIWQASWVYILIVHVKHNTSMSAHSGHPIK